jgi:hypothetical protein
MLGRIAFARKRSRTKEAVPARRRDGHGSRRGEADGDQFIDDALTRTMPLPAERFDPRVLSVKLPCSLGFYGPAIKSLSSVAGHHLARIASRALTFAKRYRGRQVANVNSLAARDTHRYDDVQPV